jgi:hypothetical protein
LELKGEEFTRQKIESVRLRIWRGNKVPDLGTDLLKAHAVLFVMAGFPRQPRRNMAGSAAESSGRRSTGGRIRAKNSSEPPRLFPSHGLRTATRSFQTENAPEPV